MHRKTYDAQSGHERKHRTRPTASVMFTPSDTNGYVSHCCRHSAV